MSTRLKSDFLIFLLDKKAEICYHENMSDKVFTLLGSSNHYGERQEEDFYSTPEIAVKKLINKLEELQIPIADNIIEPSVGKGNILIPFLEKYGKKYLAYDIVDRGFPNTIVQDWMSVKELPPSSIIVANFPYKFITDHTIHSLNLLRNGEYLISLAKIQFLETKKRYENLLKDNPPKYVMVFVERINCPKDGIDTGTSSALCYCWYIWQKGFKGNPEIIWLEGSNK